MVLQFWTTHLEHETLFSRTEVSSKSLYPSQFSCQVKLFISEATETVKNFLKSNPLDKMRETATHSCSMQAIMPHTYHPSTSWNSSNILPEKSFCESWTESGRLKYFLSALTWPPMLLARTFYQWLWGMLMLKLMKFTKTSWDSSEKKLTGMVIGKMISFIFHQKKKGQ